MLVPIGCESTRQSIALTQEFVDRARAVTSTRELISLMDAITNELGFRHYALIHHTDLRRSRPGIVNINNYPAVWGDYFVEQRLYRFDPVVQACFRTAVGFRWSNLSKLIRLNSRDRGILEGAAREGLADGMTVPYSVKDEPVGSCSFATPKNPKQFDRCELVGQLVGNFGFEAARRLIKSSHGRRSLPLSPRQHECVVLVAQGKSNWEIGTILGLSPVTIGHYLADARARYDVKTRQQLVVRALLDGDISFAEIMPQQYV